MSREALDELKQQIPLLDYLEAHHWRPTRRLSHDRWMGLCPLHEDHKPSFLVDAGKKMCIRDRVRPAATHRPRIRKNLLP